MVTNYKRVASFIFGKKFKTTVNGKAYLEIYISLN